MTWNREHLCIINYDVIYEKSKQKSRSKIKDEYCYNILKTYFLSTETHEISILKYLYPSYLT